MTNLLRWAFVGIVLIFLAAPLVVIAGVSLNEPRQLRFPPEGLSFRWYAELVTANDWVSALSNSIIIAVCGAILAVCIALPLAHLAWSRGIFITRALFALGIAPFMLPPVISALGFLIFWLTAGFYGNILATIISHGIFLTALPLVTISLGLDGIDRSLVEAARTMGASRWTVFQTVVFPLIRPYLICGFAFAAVLSLNEYIIAYMVAGFSVETLPIKVFNALRYGYTPIMASASVLFVGIAVVVFGTAAWFGELPKLLGARSNN